MMPTMMPSMMGNPLALMMLQQMLLGNNTTDLNTLASLMPSAGSPIPGTVTGSQGGFTNFGSGDPNLDARQGVGQGSGPSGDLVSGVQLPMPGGPQTIPGVDPLTGPPLQPTMPGGIGDPISDGGLSPLMGLGLLPPALQPMSSVAQVQAVREAAGTNRAAGRGLASRGRGRQRKRTRTGGRG